MSNTKYEHISGAAASNSIFGKNVEWDGTNYLVIEDTLGTGSTNGTLDANHHYTWWRWHRNKSICCKNGRIGRSSRLYLDELEKGKNLVKYMRNVYRFICY